MSRPDPFNPFDGCGDGQFDVAASGMVDKIYNLWNRDPVTVRAARRLSDSQRIGGVLSSPQ